MAEAGWVGGLLDEILLRRLGKMNIYHFQHPRFVTALFTRLLGLQKCGIEPV